MTHWRIDRMKRTTAIDLIKAKLTTRPDANELLIFLERVIGMQPPFSERMLNFAKGYFEHPDGFHWDPEEENGRE